MTSNKYGKLSRSKTFHVVERVEARAPWKFIDPQEGRSHR